MPDSESGQHRSAILSSAIASSLVAIALNILNQKYGTFIPDWLILLTIYGAVGCWFYAVWRAKKAQRLRMLLYTYPRMFLVLLIIGGAVIGAAAGAGLWVANRNEQRIKTAPVSSSTPSETKARFVGRIICLKPETAANTYREIFRGEYPLDFVVTMNVSLTNDHALAASATRFELSLLFNEKTYSGIELPIPPDTSFLKHTTPRPGGPSPLKITWKALRAFPLNTEITNTTHQIGWLKFWTGPIQDLRLDTAKITLVVFDHRNDPHLIYDGPVTHPPACGTIVEGQRESLPEWE